MVREWVKSKVRQHVKSLTVRLQEHFGISEAEARKRAGMVHKTETELALEELGDEIREALDE